MNRWIILTFIICSVVVWSYPEYRYEIPNGHFVPNPNCSRQQLPFFFRNKFSGQFDPTVGHLSAPKFMPTAEAELNPFGRDFKRVRGNWSALCRMDSDMDGITNGKELGDDYCTWTKGTEPSSSAKSHPGFHSDCNKLFINS